MKQWPKAWVGREITDWVINGCPIPPPQLVKTLSLAHIVEATGIKRFVETGTLTGNTSGMISLIPGVEVDTIELSDHYFRKSMETLRHHANVRQHLGDSAEILPALLKGLLEPAVFWLDAHYSGGETARTTKDTPINEEIAAILNHPVRNHVVVIDDMRGFMGKNGYPEAEKLQRHLEEIRPDFEFILRYDLGIFAPRETLSLLAAARFSIHKSAVIAP